ncbi:MAG: hypothetical protein OHK0012_28710 [Synechococcales cyanobacterium]
METRGHFWRRLTGGGTLQELNTTTPLPNLWQGWLNDRQPAPAIPYPDLTVTVPAGERAQPYRAEQSRRWFTWMVEQKLQTRNPIHESMVDFWRDHFVVSFPMHTATTLLEYEQRLRTHALGDFQELLWAVTTSPAMLRYLDNDRNQRGRLNENYSRELLELFTLGEGNYTEQDIREGARALTGWRSRREQNLNAIPTSFFQRQLHDPNLKTYLGQTGAWRPEDIVAILANHPGTGRYVGGKLWSAWVYPNPEPQIVERLGAVYLSSQRQIPAVVEAILSSPEFLSDRAYRSRVKSPQEFLLGSIRALGVKYEPGKVLQSLRLMGHFPYRAPSVKGWPESWITSTSLLHRLNLAQQLTQDYGDEGSFEFQPQALTTTDVIQVLHDGQMPEGVADILPQLDVRDQAAVLLAAPTYQLA